MSNEKRTEGPPYAAEEANVGHARKPKSLTKPGKRARALAESAEGTPTPEELDAREARFSPRRKPMGPAQDQVPETIPQELDEPEEQ
ncbi:MULTISPECIES: hypothetical protein [unclassified Streptomyces]|uniref:hypothetical protein n=1 Tax=unclassified Streptomyces TaxID=2593676 RepID=UPI00225B7100|nr:hypothetical protein [Streptomyces sp. NBC_00047]MCX5610762.1 hypothetical protein [Streptomyces sp. NBC_00047]